MTKKKMRYTIIFFALVALAGGVYCWQGFVKDQIPEPPAGTNSDSAAVPAGDGDTHYPVAQASKDASEKDLPTLDESDASFQQSLADIFGADRVNALFNREDIARHFVISIDAARAAKMPLQFSPLKPVPGSFLATSQGSDHFIDPANYQRYAPYVELASTADLAKLVEFYSHFYPVFQAAYADLGTPGYFNDRLVKVIDHALATPEPTEPVHLISQSVNYKFADAKLEGLSAIQKILIRMGPQNAKIVKEKLRALREKLVHLDR